MIQFRKNRNAKQQEQACIEREAGVYVELEYIDGFDETIDWHYPEVIMERYSGVVLGGSGDFDFDGNRDEHDTSRKMSYELLGTLRPLFTYLFDHDVPTLGICYGHQLLEAFAGAHVTFDRNQQKTKSHEVKLMVDKHDYFLFTDLPDTFPAQYGHKDVLDRVPEGAVLLMNGGDACKVSALRYKNNIYTTQFHPELTYEDMVARMKSIPGYLPEGVVAEEVFKESPDASRILRNFSKFVALHKRECSTVEAQTV